ncbi:plasmid partitioning protein RepB [Rhizobium sp. Root708]|uniref:plasmid partitioning protein RepB n=1 Tax=Rhizobium sp. Root708 TaxID=1736592 RepID=UPI0006FF5641|nr:plasmid partitioning protein RepB [Rhizobium sp. Root708]KRB60626.1 plasmid partitioning protein RepB [Rhizobium sp. Root708]
MARKNPFENVMSEGPAETTRNVLDYAMRGASKSILSSIGEMADRADRLLEGETVVDLDPELIEVSFIRDRLEDDNAEFDELLNAIRDRGQDSPILVRPHPKTSGRYMVVFGHRRLRVAKALGRKIRAVVKEVSDVDHVVAQGQENSARSNLSFLEKAMFANEIARRHFDNDYAVVMSALSLDKATLSKMLSVASLPPAIINAMGAAKGIGRDRWYELKTLLEKPAKLDAAVEFVQSQAFSQLATGERFNVLVGNIKAAGRPEKQRSLHTSKWSSDDKQVVADAKSDGRTFTLALKAKDAIGFGEFLSESLADLYSAYRNRKVDHGE